MIRVPQVRVVFPDGGSQIMGRDEALRKANEYGLDLVEVAPQAKPPVCKIIDHGKFKYELEKKMKEAKKHQKTIVVKEVRLRPHIGEHDYLIKLNHIKEFLQAHNKVKVTIFFRGREITHSELGMQVAERLKEDLKDMATVENQPKLEGKMITLVFSPLSKKRA